MSTYRKRTVNPETVRQRNIVESIEQTGRRCVRIFTGSTKVKRGYLHGAPKGWPDLYVLGWGWLEIKTEEGKLSDDQVAIHAEIRATGERVEVARTAEIAVSLVTGRALSAESVLQRLAATLDEFDKKPARAKKARKIVARIPVAALGGGT